MDWKKIRLIILSFGAGIMLMTGVLIGSQNHQYFTENRSYAEAGNSSQEKGSTTDDSIPVSSKQLYPLSSNNIIADMVDAAGPAVVRIETKTTPTSRGYSSSPFGDFFGFSFPSEPQESNALGSGFIINDQGYIVTNYHVIEKADSIQVFVSGFDKPFNATVVGKDPELDLAVLKLDSNEKLPYLTLGDSDAIRVGDWSVAIGNPFGLDHTVTVGVISAKSRPLNIGNQKFKNLLQTDTSINPGNSGGPLLNLNGEVIGINTAINAQGQGLGFAIPINTAKEVLDDLINKGKVSRPFVGVGLSDINAESAAYFGFDFKEGTIISQVQEGSAADQAGIKQFDVILEMDGKKIKDSQALVDEIGNHKVGDQVKFLIWRSGDLKTITVTIGEK